MMTFSDQEPGNFPRGNILGVGVHAIDMEDALDQMHSWIKKKLPNYICVTPAHAVMACQEDQKIRNVYNSSGLCTPDGIAIVWLLHLQGFKNVRRVYGPDLLLAASEKFIKERYSHFFLGGSEDTLEKVIHNLKKRFPDIKIAGGISPPFRELSPSEELIYLSKISSSKPDILWVGLGSPKQELWMAKHFKDLKVPVLVGVGAAFDFIAGTKPQAPRWMQRSGLEWLFRLFSEPRRLWKRYIQYPRFIVLALMQRFGFKKYRLE